MALPRLPDAAADGIDTLLDRSIALGFSRIGPAVRRHLPTWPADPPPDALRGQTVVVTGATSGLGLATADGVLALGARLVLVARNEEKAAGVRADLAAAHPGAEIETVLADLADLDDVRRAATDLAALGPIHAIVHNAGSDAARAVGVSPGPRAHHGRARPRTRADDRPAAARAGRRGADHHGDLGRDVRPEAARGRPGVPRPGTTPPRPRTPAASAPRSSSCPSWASAGARASASTRPTPGGRTPPGWRSRCRRSAGSPGRSCATPRAARRRRCGSPRSTRHPRPATLLHDRRVRPTHFRAGTRPSAAEVARMWRWVTTEAGLES